MGPRLRDRVAVQTCTCACPSRPPLRGHSPPRQRKLQRPPHLPGKQQLSEREDARPERRLRLPQRRAPFSERKCLEAGPGSADLGTRGVHWAFLRFLGRGCEKADITGAPRGGRRGCGGPPLRVSGLPEEAPGSPAVGLGPGRSLGRRRRTRLPRSGASGREPRRSGQAQPGGRQALTHPWPTRRSAQCGD